MTRIISQPWDGAQERTGDILRRELDDSGAYRNLTMVVAFAMRSGVNALRESLRDWLASGRGIDVFVGIDAQGTSREALESLLQLGVVTHVFHNPGSTFHPKVYLLEGPNKAFAIVGSSNLTTGGLYTNYELNIAIPIDPNNAHDAAVYDALRSAVARVRDAPNTKALTPALLEQLAEQGMLGSEAAREANPELLADRSAGIGGITSLFPRTPVPPAPRVPTSSTGAAARSGGRSEHGARASVFVMVMGRRDAGSKPGYSPDVFIPLAARDAEPSFWRWPDGFVSVSQTTGSYRERRVTMRITNPVGSPSVQTGVRLYSYKERSEFRMNVSALVSQADVGDLLVLEVPRSSAGALDYVGTIVKPDDPDFPIFDAIAVNPVPKSDKRWGYA